MMVTSDTLTRRNTGLSLVSPRSPDSILSSDWLTDQEKWCLAIMIVLTNTFLSDISLSDAFLAF